MVTVLWTIDDTYEGSVDLAVQNVIQNATSGGIVLMHDGGGNRELMIKALPLVISELKRQGFQFVTIPQLLNLADTQVRSGDAIDCKSPDLLNLVGVHSPLLATKSKDHKPSLRIGRETSLIPRLLAAG